MSDKPRNLDVSSMNPDDFSTGLPDGFVGLIRRSYYAAWVYPNSQTGKHMLFGCWDIEPDEESGFEPYTERYQAGWLNNNVPSPHGPDVDKDKREPAGGTWEFYAELANGEASIPEGEGDSYTGPYVLGPQVSKKTDWAQALRALSTLEFKDWTPAASCVEGLRCRFDRVKSERPPQEGATKEFKVLVPTEILEKVKTKGASAGKGASTKPAASGAGKSKAGAAVSASNGTDDLSSLIVAALKSDLADEDGDGIRTLPLVGERSLKKYIQSIISDTKQRITMLKEATKAGQAAADGNESAFTSGDTYIYDTETSLFTLTE